MTKKRVELQTELLYGLHPVHEVLLARRRKLVRLYTTKPEPKGFAQIKKLIQNQRVPIQYVPRATLASMAQTTDHQGVVAYAAPYPFRKKPFDTQKHPFLIMLDGIQDPRNLGAILRSAYCIGVDGAMVTQKQSAPLNAVALKSSAGLAERLEIMMVPSAQAAVHLLKESGYSLYLATTDKAHNALEVSYAKPLCVVIGSEGQGITTAILHEGERIQLPQVADDVSYNASVAAGILLFLIRHRI
ncbi:23S rRNA (guanosine(2251)-2'-O)-methyltransferase RlmB [Candidatus Babeliales bacterium]|nr:23S rRNA (guanosine(2251)-2'-O)-methyltransferase RlmB [Candidatus Babeliales bacterium]